MTIHYNKLIRDKIPDLFIKKGKKIVFHHAASGEEYWHKLKEKLQEEINEFGEKEDMNTLVDVLEVLEAICLFKKFELKEVHAVQENKAIEYGRFTKKLILDETDENLGHEQQQTI